MSSPAELLKKYIIEEKKHVYLSPDERFLVFDRQTRFSPDEIVRVEMQRGIVGFELPLKSIWLFLKEFNEYGVQGSKESTISFRNRLQLKRYFFEKDNPPPLDSDLFSPPSATSRKRERKDEEGSTIKDEDDDDFFGLSSDFQPPLKRRKLTAEELESRDMFWEFIDGVGNMDRETTTEVRNTFKTYKGIENYNVGYSPELEAYISQDDLSEEGMKRISSDLNSTQLHMNGGSYNRFTDFEFSSKLYQDIRIEEKNLEEYFKKHPHAKRRMRKKEEERRRRLRKRASESSSNISSSSSSKQSRNTSDSRVRKPPAPKSSSSKSLQSSSSKKPIKSSSSSKKEKKKKSGGATYRHLVKRTEPIIIVPGQITSVLTIFNTKPFLEGWIFRTTEECRKKMVGKGREKPKYVRVKHENKQNYKTTVFRIYDNAKYLKESDWVNVCAVFTNGKNYEFRNFPKNYRENPTYLFSKIPGFHVCFHNQKIDENVKKWPVRVLTVDKTVRSRDKGAVAGFWKIVDT